MTAVFFVHGMLFASWVAHIPHVKEQLRLGNGALGFALLGAPLGSVLAMMLAARLLPAARQSARGADSASRVLRGGPTRRFRPVAPRTLPRPPCLGSVPGNARRGHEHAGSVRRAGRRVTPYAWLPRLLEPGLLCWRGTRNAWCCDRALAERTGALPGRTLSPDRRLLDDADASRGAHGRHR